MRIVVAGAGAGKTTAMAQTVLDSLKAIDDGKIVYVVTYTNAARDRIRKKILELHGNIPKQVFVETLHAFLLREFIFPFHHLLYGQQFNTVSQIKLSQKPRFKALKIKELAENKIIHVEKVTETAKWIVYGKSNDKRIVKDKRQKILTVVSKYLDSIFIDEAQDIDKEVAKFVEVLNNKNINIHLVGDPKQDLRGRNAFKELISIHRAHVEYKEENHRCPISHVGLSNMFINDEQKQISQTTKVGKLGYVFENDIDINEYVGSENWDCTFIYKKNNRFLTHINDQYSAEQNLSYELKSIIDRSNIAHSKKAMYAYHMKKVILKSMNRVNNLSIFNSIEDFLSLTLTRNEKGKLGGAIDLNRKSPATNGILVNSIDSIKGLEGNRCLFILTTDLAAYLFQEKLEENKMMSYLYVALTRSKDELMFLITKELEEKYGRLAIHKYFKETLLITNEQPILEHNLT
ncbi:UvrD-helicase domain-containing protein [Priestia endophytica]|uniref:UvrD-helicase domain-containing protein n=1 Tax=Priestia endophytica TaxID=135735 RepID=UPI000DCA3B78|nr:UvrD-helicase domain-containing protein [Priestia endophytica]RAS75801.1 hypothetical protein A4R27_21640 [Priestia endophytica]